MMTTWYSTKWPIHLGNLLDIFAVFLMKTMEVVPYPVVVQAVED